MAARARSSSRMGRRFPTNLVDAIRKAMPKKRFHGDAIQAARRFGVSDSLIRKLWGSKRTHRISPAQEAEIRRLLKETRLTRTQIASRVGVSPATVLSKETPETARTRERTKRTPINALSPQKKSQIIIDNKPHIVNAAKRLFRDRIDLMKALGFESVEDIAQEIRLRLLEELDHFDPNYPKTRHLPMEKRIGAFVNFRIGTIAGTLVVKARKAKAQLEKLALEGQRLAEAERATRFAGYGQRSERQKTDSPMALLGLHEFSHLPEGLQSRMLKAILSKLSVIKRRDIGRIVSLRASGKTYRELAGLTGSKERSLQTLVSKRRPEMRRIVRILVEDAL